MKILLVAGTPAEHSMETPASDQRDFASRSYNYAIGLLKATALRRRPEGVEIELLDLPIARRQEALDRAQLREVLARGADWVGFSTYVWDRDLFLDAAAELKRLDPGIGVLMGGPGVGLEAERVVRESPAVDVVARGEGELSFSALVDAGFDRRAFASIPGLTYRGGDGAILSSPERAGLAALSELPSPYLTGVLKPGRKSVLIESSRGCRFRCRFCSWAASAPGLRYATRERLAEEFAWALAGGHRWINLSAAAINHDLAHLRDVRDAAREADPKGELSFSVFLKHETLDEAQLEALEGFRLDEIIIGLESINAPALRACGKAPFDAGVFERRLARLARSGSRATISLITGLPGDSVAGVARTFDYLAGLAARRPDFLNFVCAFWFSVLPGTRFWAERERRGFEVFPRGTPYLRRSPDFLPDALLETARLVVARSSRPGPFRCEEVYHDAAAGALDVATGTYRSRG